MRRSRTLQGLFVMVGLTVGTTTAFGLPWDLDMADDQAQKAYSIEIADLPEGVIPQENIFSPKVHVPNMSRMDPQAATLSAPFPASPDALERGREMFGIYCTPCHDRTGSGNGIVVQRGLKQPPSLHQDRLRNAAIGYYFDVITNGFGSMFSYASRIPVDDRWAVAAYIRALQFSQEAAYDELPAEDQRQLQ